MAPGKYSIERQIENNQIICSIPHYGYYHTIFQLVKYRFDGLSLATRQNCADQPYQPEALTIVSGEHTG